jgi:SAM-dependent methyltransferase
MEDGRRKPGTKPEMGTGKGQVYPARKARGLLNPLRRLVQSPRTLATRMAASESAHVLELGCGPGFFSPSLAAEVPQGHLELCDFQPEMLAIASRQLDESGMQRYRAVSADALALPYPDESFDVAVLVAMLGEVGNSPACISEVARVLRRGGRLVVSETRGDPDFTPFSKLDEMAGDAGLACEARHGRRLTYTARFRKGEATNGEEGTRDPASLACPSCSGAVHSEGEAMICSSCSRRYPVREGIPVMIIDGDGG